MTSFLFWLGSSSPAPPSQTLHMYFWLFSFFWLVISVFKIITYFHADFLSGGVCLVLLGDTAKFLGTSGWVIRTFDFFYAFKAKLLQAFATFTILLCSTQLMFYILCFVSLSSIVIFFIYCCLFIIMLCFLNVLLEFVLLSDIFSLEAAYIVLDSYIF